MELEGELVENSISRYGLRTLHVMNFRRPADRLEWMARYVPGHAVDGLRCMQQVEEGLEIHHLWLWWPARELVRVPARLLVGANLNGASQGPAVFWWTGKSGRLRESADLAAWAYQIRTGCWPRVAAVRTLHKEAPETIEIEGKGRPVVLQLVPASWVPSKFVVVY